MTTETRTHTPGPWTLKPSAHHREWAYWVDGPDSQTLAAIGTGSHEDADAHLVESAPDLLAALEELVAEFDNADRIAAMEPGCGGINPTGGILIARDAIAKARA